MRPTQSGFAQHGDVALVLHTSGTTSKPKIVPLTQTNIFASAFSIKTTLALTDSDRCLNVMPLFHIHGLIGALVSSLTAGGSIVCTPGFYAPRFFEWIEEFHPTWYTAVPTMHQAILARSPSNREVIERCPLRFIRSCSSALPPQVMAELEGAFNVPVIEAYGMTEASHQVASNPLPPRERKAGSVGIAAGPDGNLWFAEIAGNGIGRITTEGVVTEYLIPTHQSQPVGIAPGPDRNLWFTESYGNKIGRITTEGAITEFLIPTAESNPLLIAAGPDRNLWFAEGKGNNIGVIHPSTAGPRV